VPVNIGQQHQLAIPKSKAPKTPHYFLVQQAWCNPLFSILLIAKAEERRKDKSQ
jgi:hypothetical protein